MSRRADSALLVSNEPSETRALRNFLASRGFAVHVTTSPSAIQSLASRSYGLVLVDVGLPGIDGVALTRRALEFDQATHIVLIAHGGMTPRLIEALGIGATDYVTTPIIPEELERKLAGYRASEEPATDEPALVAVSDSLKTLVSRAARACGVNLPVFLDGELGSGRKTVARAIHRFGGTRTEPFLVVNLKAIPAHLVATELFGSPPIPGDEPGRVGALGAAGRGGVFLDNVDAMPASVQLKLIGTLDTGMIHPLGPRFDARLYCGSVRDLETLVSQGVFQSGLHYRLNLLRLSLPPLRQRPEDVAALASHFLRRFSEATDKTVVGVSPEAMAALCHYAWPGNVRELANVMEKAFVLASDVVHLSHLPPQISRVTIRAQPGVPAPEPPV
jgi:DNA-binding NtrC family response regulator